MTTQFDVIVVGARIAGSALAYHLSQSGFRVLLLDRGSFPSDVLSTHNFFNNSMAMLREIGVLGQLLATATPTYNRVRIQFGGAVIDGTVPMADGETDCLCIRRIYLDQILFEHAKSQPNITAIEGFRVTELLREGDTVSGVIGKRRKDNSDVSYTAKLVVGADGRLSTIRKLAGSKCKLKVPTDFASYVGYVTGYTQDGPPHAELFRQGDKYAIAFPTSDDQYVLGIMFPLDDRDWMDRFKIDPKSGIRDLVDAGFTSTTLPQRLRPASFVGSVRGLNGYDNDWHQGMGKGWALVGDALTFKDPTVGTGMHDALYGAKTLSDLLAGVHPEQWDQSLQAVGEAYQNAMESKLMPHFMLGCQFTKNVPIVKEQEAAYSLIGSDKDATEVLLGFYNYRYTMEDVERGIGRLLSGLGG